MPRHKYLPATPGCWKLYGELLAKEYSDLNYWRVHRLTVDTYSVQHTQSDDPRNIQSVNVHLVALYMGLEKKLSSDAIPPIMSRVIQIDKGAFVKLKAPSFHSVKNVSAILPARNATEHCRLVQDWANEVWEIWETHHTHIRKIAEPFL